MPKRISGLFIVSLLFIVLICIMTFPLLFTVTTCMPGFFSTDESFVVLWNAWVVKYSFVHHLSMARTDFINFPFGIDLLHNRPNNYLWVIVNGGLALATTPVLTYNIQLIANLFLTALCVFLLGRRITSNAYAGFFSSVIFTFCPAIAIRSWQHLLMSWRRVFKTSLI